MRPCGQGCAKFGSVPVLKASDGISCLCARLLWMLLKLGEARGEAERGGEGGGRRFRGEAGGGRRGGGEGEVEETSNIHNVKSSAST